MSAQLPPGRVTTGYARHKAHTSRNALVIRSLLAITYQVLAAKAPVASGNVPRGEPKRCGQALETINSQKQD